jgi:hypothetical protein
MIPPAPAFTLTAAGKLPAGRAPHTFRSKRAAGKFRAGAADSQQIKTGAGGVGRRTLHPAPFIPQGSVAPGGGVGVGVGVGEGGGGGILSFVKRGKGSSRMARWKTAAATTMAARRTSSSTTRS